MRKIVPRSARRVHRAPAPSIGRDPDPPPLGDERGRGLRRDLPPAQPVRRRLREGPHRLRREARRGEADRGGHQRHADLARSAFELHGRQELPRHAGPDPRRVRRPRHRGHDGGRPDQGRHPDRRHAGRQGRHPGERRHHADRRRPGPGPDPEPGGRQDARPGQLAGQAQDQPQGVEGPDRGHAHPRRDQDQARCARASRAATSATSA